MTYRGHIKNGVAILDDPVRLPDGTPVQVGVDPSDSAFWRGQTIDELARQQRVLPVNNLDDLAGDWPENESLDDFLAMIRRSPA